MCDEQEQKQEALFQLIYSFSSFSGGEGAGGGGGGGGGVQGGGFNPPPGGAIFNGKYPPRGSFFRRSAVVEAVQNPCKAFSHFNPPLPGWGGGGAQRARGGVGEGKRVST